VPILQPEIITQLLATFTCLVGVVAFRRPNSKFLHLVFGISASLLVLCKGYFIIFTAFMIFVYLFSFFRNKKVNDIYALALFVGGFLLLLMPWTWFINSAVQNGIDERLKFTEILRENATTMVENRSEIYADDGSIRGDIILSIILTIQYLNSAQNDFFLITNQVNGNHILDVNNEYCIDGGFHPEWRVIQSSFYNTKSYEGKYKNLFYFYTENPLLGMEILLGRIGFSAKSLLGVIYWFAVLLIPLTFFSLSNKREVIPLIVFMLNIFLTIILVMGYIQSIQTIFPIILIFIAYSAISIIRLQKYKIG
jgi:4-amino-4-deoxy-L-arabinose transferase-like glycosyltransferase